MSINSLLCFFVSPLLAQETSEYTTSGKAPGPVFWICYIAVLIFMIAAMWKVFTKAGQPGWAILIPFYNLYVLCKIAGRPGWWIILCLIPFVNFIIFIILDIDIAKNFGKGVGFGIGLLLLPFIFFPILGFGSATYQGTSSPALA
jgi:uncharacterized membrane protein YhaH (DUF805 family)